jgi:hypothetical protein
MNPNWQVRYFYDVGEDGTLRKVPRERELSVPESMRRPRPSDPVLAALNDGVVKKSEKDFRQANQDVMNQMIRKDPHREAIARKRVDREDTKLKRQGHKVTDHYDNPDETGITSSADMYEEVKHKDGPATRVSNDRPLGEYGHREKKAYRRHWNYQESKDLQPKGKLIDAKDRFTRKSETGFGVDSEGFLSRRTSFVGKEEQGQRKKHDGFRAQDDYDSEDRGAWVTPAPDSKTSKRSTDPHLGPVKKPERLDLWTESTDDASLRFK